MLDFPNSHGILPFFKDLSSGDTLPALWLVFCPGGTHLQPSQTMIFGAAPSPGTKSRPHSWSVSPWIQNSHHAKVFYPYCDARWLARTRSSSSVLGFDGTGLVVTMTDSSMRCPSLNDCPTCSWSASGVLAVCRQKQHCAGRGVPQYTARSTHCMQNTLGGLWNTISASLAVSSSCCIRLMSPLTPLTARMALAM